MDKKTTTFGRDPGGIARLLGIGAEADQGGESPEEAKADLLRARLSGTLPLETAVVEDLPAIAGRLCEDLFPLRGKPLGDALLDKETSLAVLERIKDYGKKLAGRKDRETEHAVGIAIYFAAIASALLFHDKRITSYGHQALTEAFGTLIEKRWVAPELVRHFSKARKLCARKKTHT